MVRPIASLQRMLQILSVSSFLTTTLISSRRTQTKLSSYRTDDEVFKKVVFSPDCVEKFKSEKFTYSEKPRFVFQKPLAVINNSTDDEDFFIEDYNEKLFWFAEEDDYYERFFNGPRFNLEVKKSAISDQISHQMYGLYARENIRQGELLGIYNGLTTFGAEADWDNYPLTDLKWEYVYMGERDYMDSAYFGNFMRFANHQDYATIDYSNHFVPKTQYFERGLITAEQFDILPDFIEIIAMYTIQDIEAGEEIFLNYGEYYWKDLNLKPVRVNNVKILNRAVEDLENQVKQLEKEKKSLEYKLKGSRKTIEAYKKYHKK